MDVAPTKKLLIVCSLAVGIVIVLGCVMPILATPSNCGGNSAALNKCCNYGLSVRIRFVRMGRPLVCRPEGTSESSPAFQRWVGRQKASSPEGTAEFQSHTPSFSRPFGTYVPCGLFPGVKTPGYSLDVPPGQRNVAAAFSSKQVTRFICDAFEGISRPKCPSVKLSNALAWQWLVRNPSNVAKTVRRITTA